MLLLHNVKYYWEGVQVSEIFKIAIQRKHKNRMTTITERWSHTPAADCWQSTSSPSYMRPPPNAGDEKQ